MTTPRSTTSHPRPAAASHPNPTFERALALLAHPACLAALGLLLINDHLLRRWWPSWWTGKAGDLAWLLFAPFAAAAALAWLLPLREPARGRWTFPLAFGLVGGVFGTLKLSPALMEMATRSSSAALQTNLSVRPDPTDLLALPILGLGVYLWKKSLSTPLPRAPLGLIALPLAALLTLANAAMPDPGITCLAHQDGRILARAAYTTFASQDGGLTWQRTQMGFSGPCDGAGPGPDDWQEAPGPAPDSRYRYRPGGPIELSADGGQTWQPGFDPAPITEAQESYYRKTLPGNPAYQPGPLHALADPGSGNMLFAMGHQGVLVHTAAGSPTAAGWTWSAVDGYHALEPFPTADAFSVLLGGMLYLAAGLALLIFATLALRWLYKPLRLALVVLAWIAWLLVGVLFPPAASYSYAMSISALGVLGMFVLLVPLVIEQSVRLARLAPRSLLPLAGFGLLGGLLYLLPYLLWVYSTLPAILWATIFGVLIAAAVLGAGFYALRQKNFTTKDTQDTKKAI